MRQIPRLLLGIAMMAVLLVSLAFIAFRLVDPTSGTLSSSGDTRRYLLYVPGSYDGTHPVPLVISIHGFAQWPAHQAMLTHWNEVADEEGFIVVYPEGTGFPRRWRAGTGDAVSGAQVDVAFLADLIDTLAREYAIDPARVYVNGMSNGAGMTFALSCTLAERIAAMGLVAGAYLYPEEACAPARPVPAIVFHGTDDPIVPFGGGPSRSFDRPFPDISRFVASLAERNGCSDGAVPSACTPNLSRTEYQGCEADVVYYTIHGGGHTWAGGQGIPAWIGGTTNEDIDATRAMWAFFSDHPREP
ncbi:MAG: hypothetical protein GXX94_05195 [Chloroflexi bacterium]|nr:hypothetical protein [Chloroflexota bacterium]